MRDDEILGAETVPVADREVTSNALPGMSLTQSPVFQDYARKRLQHNSYTTGILY